MATAGFENWTEKDLRARERRLAAKGMIPPISNQNAPQTPIRRKKEASIQSEDGRGLTADEMNSMFTSAPAVQESFALPAEQSEVKLGNRVRLFIPGYCAPAGSKTGFALKKNGVFTGRVAIVDASKKSKGWKKQIAEVARAAYPKFVLLEKAIIADFEFIMARPKCDFGTGKNSAVMKASAEKHHIKKPDCLKMARAAEDALTGVIWQDDAQIVDEHIRKRFAALGETAGCKIVIAEIL